MRSSTLSLDGDEPLYPLACEHFTGVDIAFGVGGDHVEPEELASVFAHASHLADDLAVLAVEEPDVVIGEVGNVQELLLLVGREYHASGGTADACHRGQDELLLVLALFRENLDAVGV